MPLLWQGTTIVTTDDNKNSTSDSFQTARNEFILNAFLFGKAASNISTSYML